MKQKILDYLEKLKLPMLDRGINHYNRNYYTAVTIPYLAKYVAEANIEDTIGALKSLVREKKVEIIYCITIGEFVVEVYNRRPAFTRYFFNKADKNKKFVEYCNSLILNYRTT